MENNKNSTKNIALNLGLLLGLGTIIISVLTYIINMPLKTGWISGLVGILLMIGLIYYGIKKYKDGNQGYLSLADALKVGLAIALIGGILSSLYQMAFLEYIDPEYINRVKELQFEKMLEENPNMSNDQIKLIKDIGSKNTSPWISFAGALIGNLFFGFVFALISGFILKKDNNTL